MVRKVVGHSWIRWRIKFQYGKENWPWSSPNDSEPSCNPFIDHPRTKQCVNLMAHLNKTLEMNMSIKGHISHVLLFVKPPFLLLKSFHLCWLDAPFVLVKSPCSNFSPLIPAWRAQGPSLGFLLSRSAAFWGGEFRQKVYIGARFRKSGDLEARIEIQINQKWWIQES